MKNITRTVTNYLITAYDLVDGENGPEVKIVAQTSALAVSMTKSEARAALAEAIGATQSAVSHQLRQLKQAHLVKFQRDGKSVIYSLSDDHVYTMLAQGMTHICE